MQTRAGRLARIGVLSVCAVAASHDDRDAVVLAQPANATQNGVVTGELVIEPADPDQPRLRVACPG